MVVVVERWYVEVPAGGFFDSFYHGHAVGDVAQGRVGKCIYACHHGVEGSQVFIPFSQRGAVGKVMGQGIGINIALRVDSVKY